MDYLTLVLGLFFVWTCIHVSRSSSAGRAGLPPGPNPFPIIGNILALGKRPHESLSNLSKIYGPLVSLKLGTMTTIVVSSPSMAKQVLQKHDQIFSSRTLPNVVQVLNHHEASIVWSSALSPWRNLRKICKEHVFSTRCLDANQGLRQKKDLFVAGTDTTSSTVEWAMAELLKKPKILAKAQAELKEVICNDGIVQEADISRLPYLQAVVKEILQLHPSAPLLLPHKAEANVEISGFMVPKHAQVLVNVWAIGRDSSIWLHPDSFVPERFLDLKVDMRGQGFELIPFGAGRRMCPGILLAYQMVHFMLASLLHSFDWKLGGGMESKDIDMSEKFGITLRKAIPLKAIPISN
ncbi:hypothetical protein ACSBR2_016818 [Camellia fascicularis]